jgi:O-antigen/teichoic acid export membrane protein
MNERANNAYRPHIASKYVWLFAGRILPLAALFFITILYSRRLSYDEYGIFQSMWMYANIINVVISFGFASVVLSTNTSFLFAFIRSYRRTLISFYTLLWAGGFLLFFLCSKNFSEYQRLLIILFMAVQNIITVAEALLIRRHREKTSFVINLLYSLLFFGWHLYVLLTHYSLAGLVAGISIISTAKLIAVLVFPATDEAYVQVAEDMHFLRHWGYLGINEILGVVSKWVDKVFLLYLLTTADFAVFFNGSFEIPLFGLLISVAGNLMLIEFSSRNQDPQKIKGLFRESFKMLSTIVFPLFFFLFFFREEIFSWLFKNRYGASVPIFTISIFILPLRINNYSVILQSFSQGKKVMMGSVLDIVIALALMMMLYPLLGSRGIALSVVISTYCQVFYYLWHSASLLKTTMLALLPFQNLVARFIILLIMYLVLFLLLQNASTQVRLLAGVLLTTVVAGIEMRRYYKTFLKNNYGLIA